MNLKEHVKSEVKMASIKDLLMECDRLKRDNITLQKQVLLLRKQVEEFLKEDTSLRF